MTEEGKGAPGGGYPVEGPLEVVLTLVRGGHSHRVVHRLHAPGVEEWNRYFEQSAVVRRERRQLIVEDRSAAVACALWDAHAVAVEGYRAGPRPLMELADWRARVPAAHKVRAVERLGEVEPAAEPEGEALDVGALGDRPIALRARLAGRDCLLIHRLRRPDAAELRRYESQRALRRITAGGESVGSGWLKAAAELYDRLFVTCQGYAVESADRIPALHKKAAVDQLLGARDGWEEADSDADGDLPAAEAWEKN